MAEGKRTLGSPRCSREENFKMEISGIKLGRGLIWLWKKGW
jgi:hypothetical protein